MNRFNTYRSGFITLISILVMSAVVVAIAASLLVLGADASRTGFAASQSYKAKALANACAEEALEQIRSSTPFIGSGNLSLGDGSCTYTVVDNGGQNRTVTVSGTVAGYVRRAEIQITQINPTITVSSWQEVVN